MQSRDRFLNAFTDTPPDRPPVWIMRQAGRYLPEYRALKERYDFLTLVKTPDLATEVTLQPIRRYPVLDAAIIFSDILIVPEAMGLPYHFREKGGIEMASAVRSAADVDALHAGSVRERTAYLPAALRQVHGALNGEKALLGFGGSPWTLATYMVEGGSSRDFSHIRSLFNEDRATFDQLMEKITEAVRELFLSQIEAGIDALQIFDSWAAAAPGDDYANASLQWIARIIEGLPAGFPVILFAKGRSSHHQALLHTGARAFAADHGVDLAAWKAGLPADVTVQGNLDPDWMTREPEQAARAADHLLERMRPFSRYIFNLGHGITPQARPETVQAVLERVDAGGPATPR
jgi:uroporphyrinogen decarboxylase